MVISFAAGQCLPPRVLPIFARSRIKHHDQGSRRGMTVPIGDSRLAARLRREIAGEVLFGPGDRGRYATDASIYQIEPIGVIVPRRIEDVMAALAICRED